LEKIRKKCFSFFWIGKGEKGVIPLVKWNKLARTDEDGSLGLNNIHLFILALAAKIL
jgi:hypothetical protein